MTKPTAKPPVQIRIVKSMAEIPAAAWDACATGPSLLKVMDENRLSSELSTRGQFYNPFVSHDFLLACEQSKSVGARTGWQPSHLLVEGSEGSLLAAAPCYVKSHSKGEYVFDQG